MKNHGLFVVLMLLAFHLGSISNTLYSPIITDTLSSSSSLCTSQLQVEMNNETLLLAYDPDGPPSDLVVHGVRSTYTPIPEDSRRLLSTQGKRLCNNHAQFSQ